MGNVFLSLSYCNLLLIKTVAKKYLYITIFLAQDITLAQKFYFQTIWEEKSVSVFYNKAKEVYLENNENVLEQMHNNNTDKWTIIKIFKLF